MVGRRFRTLGVVIALAAVVPAAGGCQLGCQTGLSEGVLVADDGGLGIRADGILTRVVWPFGYTIRMEGATRTLVDLGGTIKAREGDHVAVTGGLGTDGFLHACDDIAVTPSGSSGP